MIRVFIVDDELYARKRLVELLKRLPQIEVLGEAENATSAYDQISELRPDLVFLDIEMPEINGLILGKILTQLNIAIIFTTAHSEFALDSFDLNTVDYLLKPIKTERLQQALSKLHRTPPPRSLNIKVGNKHITIPYGDILYFSANESYSRLHTAEKEFTLSESLDSLENRLHTYGFIRCHRSYIVNKLFIQEIRRIGDRQYELIVCKNPLVKLKVGRTYLKNIDLIKKR